MVRFLLAACVVLMLAAWRAWTRFCEGDYQDE